MPSSNNIDPGQDAARILIVDDEESVRLALKKTLEYDGFSVVDAEDGPTALRLAEVNDFDVILLDLKMPGMNGMDVFDALMRSGDSAEVIFLTGHGTISSAVNALKQGALDYLQKPWAGDDIVSKVQYAVDVRRHKTRGLLQRAFDSLAQQYQLTNKQSEVCGYLLGGMSNAHIAARMSISAHTVKTHLKNIFAKLNIESRTEMIARILEKLEFANKGPPRAD